MSGRVALGTIQGIKIEARLPALWTSAVLVLVLTAVAYFWLSLPVATALAYAVLGTLLHWLSDIGHQLGHAYAARRTGYPMQRLILMYFLVASLYPRDEPDLPAEIHIRRALGGPVFSATASLVILLFVWLLQPAGGLLYYLAALLFIDNFGVMTLGAFLPLGFTDGSTLLRWWPRRGRPAGQE